MFAVLLLLAVGSVSCLEGQDLPPFALNATITQAQRFAYGRGVPPSLGINVKAYLDVIGPVFQHFRQFQNTDASSPDYGKIIDPYAHEEIQYSTPTFAFAGATLYRYKHFDSTPAAEMLASVDLAMTAALTALVYGQPHGNEGCAQGHCNFYTMPLMLAIETLNGTVNASLFNTWTRLATQIVPTRAYRAWPHATGNWAVVALTGEFIRFKLGLKADGIDDIVEQLAFQFNPKVWTDNGEYQDHSGCSGACNPMPYDHFPRKYMSVLLMYGYDGPNATMYWELNRRGAWTSLLLQSPWGELPTGGRSSQHQWNEAVSCVTYELWASLLSSNGDADGAGVFKRAAGLSLKSLQRWKRPTGEWTILKNRYDPAVRHGYESYSYYAQYNLLPASMLATAIKFANEDIEERFSFAETGGFVFQPDQFHKVIANANGTYVESELYADAPPHDVTGLTRIHHRSVDPLVSITAGGPLQMDGFPANPHAAGVGAAWATNTTVLEYCSVVSQSPSFDPSRFSVSNILWSDNDADDQASLWVLPDSTTGSQFVVELVSMSSVGAIRVRNSHNGVYRDRSTKSITVQVSNSSAGPWQTVVSSDLSDVMSGNSLPWDTFTFPAVTAMFVRLTTDACVNKGCALNSFSIPGVTPQSKVVLKTRCLGDASYKDMSVASTTHLPVTQYNQVAYGVDYTLDSGVTVSEQYKLSDTEVVYSFSAASLPVGAVPVMQLPAFLTDGNRTTAVALDKVTNTLTVTIPGDAVSQLPATCASFHVLGNVSWYEDSAKYASRNGYFKLYYAVSTTDEPVSTFVFSPHC